MKKIITVLLFSVMMFCFTVSIHAENEASESDGNVSACKIYDDAGLIPDENEININTAMQELSKKSGWNIIGITGVKSYNQTAINYADDYYRNIFGDYTNGIAYFVDMENRKVAVTTFGEVKKIISDDNAQEMIDAVKSHLRFDEVGEAMVKFVSSTENYCSNNIPDETTVTDEVKIDPLSDTFKCKIYDKSEIFSEKDEIDINKAMRSLSEKTGWNIMGITEYSTTYEDISAYAENYYIDIFGRQTDGIVYYIDTYNHNVAVATFGNVQLNINSSDIDEMIKNVMLHVCNDEFDSAIFKLISSTEDLYDLHNISDETTINSEVVETEPIQDIFESKIYDDAGVISDEDEIQMNMEIEELSQQTNWNIIGVTGNDSGYKSAREYAEDYYIDIFGYNTEGIVCYLDTNTNDVAIMVFGYAKNFISMDDVDEIIFHIQSYTALDAKSVMQTFILDVKSDREVYDNYIAEKPFVEEKKVISFEVITGFFTSIIDDIAFTYSMCPLAIPFVIMICVNFGIVLPIYILKRRCQLCTKQINIYWDNKNFKFERNEDVFTHRELTECYCPDSSDSDYDSGGGDSCGGSEDSF